MILLRKKLYTQATKNLEKAVRIWDGAPEELAQARRTPPSTRLVTVVQKHCMQGPHAWLDRGRLPVCCAAGCHAACMHRMHPCCQGHWCREERLSSAGVVQSF